MNMKICSSCGNYLVEDTRFCTFCGSELDNSKKSKKGKKQNSCLKLKGTQTHTLRLKF